MDMLQLEQRWCILAKVKLAESFKRWINSAAEMDTLVIGSEVQPLIALILCRRKVFQPRLFCHVIPFRVFCFISPLVVYLVRMYMTMFMQDVARSCLFRRR